MKLSALLITVTASVFVLPSHAQGSFTNLNFEAANVTGYSQNANNVPTGNALPGWITGAPTVWYDAISAGGPLISINDAKSYPSPLQGNYSVLLFGGEGVTESISQTGLVPAGTQSMTVEIGNPFPLLSQVPFEVTLGDQNTDMVVFSSAANYTLYGANIAAYAGTSCTLTFSEPSPQGAPSPSVLMLDDIVFSPNAVPEPTTWTLMLCGAVLFGIARYANPKLKV